MDVYARLMHDGISMAEIDRMDILRYFDVLLRAIERGDDTEMKPGTIDDIFG